MRHLGANNSTKCNKATEKLTFWSILLCMPSECLVMTAWKRAYLLGKNSDCMTEYDRGECTIRKNKI